MIARQAQTNSQWVSGVHVLVERELGAQLLRRSEDARVNLKRISLDANLQRSVGAVNRGNDLSGGVMPVGRRHQILNLQEVSFNELRRAETSNLRPV